MESEPVCQQFLNISNVIQLFLLANIKVQTVSDWETGPGVCQVTV